MIFPEKLKKGDTIGLVAPSSPITAKRADACVKLMEDMGYKVKAGKCLYRSIRGYSAGTGEERAAELNEMFADKDVKAIFCVRGGDTSSHVVDKLDLDVIRKNPKIFVGYSDITNYHVIFNQKCDLITFHGPMVSSNMVGDYDDYSKESLEKALNMDKELVFQNPEGQEIMVMTEGCAKGQIVGGNLSLIASMIGTPYEIDTKGKILFIEDVGESVERVDRMLYQLKYSGKLNDASGFVIGDFKNCNNRHLPEYDINALMKEVLTPYNKPIFYNIKSGHSTPMGTIIFGINCVMDTKTKTLMFYR